MYAGQTEPDYSNAVGLLQHLTLDELRRLLDDDSRLNEMIKDVPQVRSAEMEKEMLLASNKSLAEFNLSREPRLRQAKQRLVSTYEIATSVYSEVEQCQKELESLKCQTSVDTTLALLQTSAAQSEEESEELAEKLLEGGMNLDEFLEEFQSKRKIAHLRRIRVEKMTELMNRQNQPQSGATNDNWVAPPPTWGSPTGSGVYAQPAVRMPMPSY